MKRHLPWYKRCPADWQQGTRRHNMSFELRGFYSECLDAMWEMQGELPKDDKALAMMLGSNPRKVRALMTELIALGKMIETETGYYNPRMMADIKRSNQPRTNLEPTSNQPRKLEKTQSFLRATLDTEADTEKKERIVGRDDLPTPSAPAEKLPASKTKKGSRLPDAWVLPEDWRQWARVNFPASTDATVTAEADKFRDYWIAQTGAKATKADWQATWRNWCRVGLARMPAKGQPMNWGRNAYDETAIWKKPHVRKSVVDTSSRAYSEEMDRQSKARLDALWGPEPEWMTPPEKRPKSKEELEKLAAEGWMS